MLEGNCGQLAERLQEAELVLIIILYKRQMGEWEEDKQSSLLWGGAKIYLGEHCAIDADKVVHVKEIVEEANILIQLRQTTLCLRQELPEESSKLPYLMETSVRLGRILPSKFLKAEEQSCK